MVNLVLKIFHWCNIILLRVIITLFWWFFEMIVNKVTSFHDFFHDPCFWAQDHLTRKKIICSNICYDACSILATFNRRIHDNKTHLAPPLNLIQMKFLFDKIYVLEIKMNYKSRLHDQFPLLGKVPLWITNLVTS